MCVVAWRERMNVCVCVRVCVSVSVCEGWSVCGEKESSLLPGKRVRAGGRGAKFSIPGFISASA